MVDFWVEEKKLLPLNTALDEAKKVVLGLMHGLEAHKESHFKTVRRGDIDPVDEPVHCVSMSLEESIKLGKLCYEISRWVHRMTEPEDGEEEEGVVMSGRDAAGLIFEIGHDLDEIVTGWSQKEDALIEVGLHDARRDLAELEKLIVEVSG